MIRIDETSPVRRDSWTETETELPTLEAVLGDITTENVDAIVNADPSLLRPFRRV